jgi:hypothetical protein
MWFRMLAARYEVDRTRLRDGGRKGSSWWREIERIRDGIRGTEGGLFRECVSILEKGGDGSDTSFWADPWLRGVSLCERFGRLFDLAENKFSTVVEMFSAE